jgi:Ca2+-binding EF-hand superfamily protein
MTGINKDDFFQMLAILGLFATRAQSDQLFEKYDANGSGNLSIHEFWVQCRPSDYRCLTGFENKQKVDEAIMHRARKRMFIRESLLHTAVATPTVHQAVYSIPIERLLSGIRDKIRQNSMVDYTLSTPRTRRFLQKLFEYNDPMATGQVDARALKRVLDHINFSAISPYYIQTLCQHFPGSAPDTIDYVSLCLGVYPQEARPPLTSVLGQGPIYTPPEANRPFSATMRPSPFNNGSMTQRPASSMSRFSQTGRPRPASRGGAMTSRGQPRPPSQMRRPISRA